MLTHIVRALLAALTCFRSPIQSRFQARPPLPRPLWDNGINYDIPTYLRRNVM